MEIKIKRMIAILLAVLFLVSWTGSAASASHPVLKSIPGNAYGAGHNNAGGNPDPGSNAGGNRWGNDKYTTNEMPCEEK